MKATVNQNLCIGCGICEIVCPEVFRMNGVGRQACAVVYAETVPEEASIFCVDAQDCCKPKAIQIIDGICLTPEMTVHGARAF